jgi:hypothetical protein
MEKSAFLSGSFFAAFTLFLFYQQKLSRDFNGASQIFHSFLTFFAFAGFAAQIIYFIYYGWNISWLDASLIFILSTLFAGIGGAILEKFLHGLMIALVGFFSIPLFGYMMFKTMPITN